MAVVLMFTKNIGINTELDMRVFSCYEKIIIISGTSSISRLSGTGITTCGI